MKKGYIVLIVIVGLFLILFSWIKGVYNNIVTMDEGVTAQWHQVETQYQRRMDLIPNLVNTVQGYSNFEKSTLTEVTALRSSASQASGVWNDKNASVADKIKATQQMESVYGGIKVIFEKYPDLKAGEQYSSLMAELSGTENRVATERRRFNEAAQNFNTYIRRFPQNIFAGMFNFKTRDYFSADQGAEKAPQVKFN